MVVIGIFSLLALAACIIRVFNHSKTRLQWFSYLLNQIGVILFYILFLDLQLMVLIAAIAVVWIIAFYSLTWGEANLSQFWYYILISLSFIYFLLWLWWTGTKNFYSQFSFRKKKEDDMKNEDKSVEKQSLIELAKSLMKGGALNFLIPLTIIIGLVMLCITCFAALTAALNDNGNITFIPKIELQGMEDISQFYLWHFCDLIPQIKVVETLNWKVPFKYCDAGIAWLLLLFKSLMAYIVIARFYSWNKWRKEPREKMKLS